MFSNHFKNQVLNKSFITVLCLLAINFTYSQVTSISGNVSFPAEAFIQKEIDSVRYQIAYELNYVANPKQRSSVRNGICILQIGDSHLKFADANTYKSDSLRNEFQHLKSIGTKEINQLISARVIFPYKIYLDTKSRVYTLHNRLSHAYAYSEPIPKMEWKIDSQSTKKIGDYLVKKATTKYAGRSYEAWFTEEIPLPYGPYIFQGLPGLILEIKDKNEDYSFAMISIEKSHQPMFEGNPKEVLKVTREKYKELERTYHENPSQSIGGAAYNLDGSLIAPKLKPRPYNPIELK